MPELVRAARGHHRMQQRLHLQAQARIGRVTFRQHGQNVRVRHHKPAQRAPPDVRGKPRLRVGPLLRPRAVPRMGVQAAFKARLVKDQRHLLRRQIRPLHLAEGHGKFRQERAGHVNAVQPHLLGVELFVPEAALRRRRLTLDLLDEAAAGLFIFRLARRLEQPQRRAPHADHIQIVFVRLIGQNLAVRGHVLIHVRLGRVVEAAVARRRVNIQPRLGDDPPLVAPVVVILLLARKRPFARPNGLLVAHRIPPYSASCSVTVSPRAPTMRRSVRCRPRTCSAVSPASVTGCCTAFITGKLGASSVR